MRATVLSDNISTPGLKGEWGLSIFITYEGKNILLDAGASGLFAQNARKLGVPIDQVDYAVLSHAHYDHANGIPEFFRANARAKCYLQSGCHADCYGKKWIFRKYIGMPKSLWKDSPERLEAVNGSCEICPGVHLLGHTTPGLEQIGRRERMYRKNGGQWQPDDFSHEQSLVFDTADGLVIFNSCSHGGADTIIREVSKAYPGKQLLAMVGGFHLFNKTEAEVRDFAKRVQDTGVAQVYTGHCTGERAYEILKETLGEKLHQLRVGLVIELGIKEQK